MRWVDGGGYKRHLNLCRVASLTRVSRKRESYAQRRVFNVATGGLRAISNFPTSPLHNKNLWQSLEPKLFQVDPTRLK